MSLRKKITVIFILVNAISLALIRTSVVREGNRVQERLDSDRGLIAQRTADVLAINFKNSIERELGKLLQGADPARHKFDEFETALAISSLSYWDEDPLVKKLLDRAVLVRLGPLDVNRFNPRPRLIFEAKGNGPLDKGGLRERLERATGIEKETLDNDSVLVYGMMDQSVAENWGFLFRLRPQEPFSFKSEDMVTQILSITLPGTLLLLFLLYVFFSRSVLRPLAAAETAALRISAGDYSRRLDDADRDDEIGRVAQAMNMMMLELQKFRDHMEGLVDEATERFKQAEQGLVVAERLAAMGRIAAGIAHEINNPLGGILNAINRLGQAELSPERRKKYYELAEESVRRIQTIVQRVLQATPRGETRVQDIELARVVEQARGLLGHRSRSEGVEIVSTLPSDLLVVGDSNELTQVFLNILINALDASAEGSKIEISAAASADDEITIVVADEGEGMTAEVRERIFDLFYTTKPGNKGTGLGLGIVHNIVTGHGGRISVESAPGRGSRFEIVLPRRRLGSDPDGRRE